VTQSLARCEFFRARVKTITFGMVSVARPCVLNSRVCCCASRCVLELGERILGDEFSFGGFCEDGLGIASMKPDGRFTQPTNEHFGAPVLDGIWRDPVDTGLRI
jgi:hypothetical protein